MPAQRRARSRLQKAANEFLAGLSVGTRTRPRPPRHRPRGHDDPVHGRQPLRGYHGYYRRHQ